MHLHQAMNVFQYGVLNGLGWIAVLADGWILHTHWLAAAGFLWLAWSTWKLLKELDMTTPEHGFNGTTAEDLAKAASKTVTFASKMPVGDIKVYEGEKYYRFVPKDDMTGQEAAWVAMLFTTAVISSRGVGITDYDYMGFVRAHGLERHFEEELS
jgi:hypothetical protein